MLLFVRGSEPHFLVDSNAKPSWVRDLILWLQSYPHLFGSIPIDLNGAYYEVNMYEIGLLGSPPPVQ